MKRRASLDMMKMATGFLPKMILESSRKRKMMRRMPRTDHPLPKKGLLKPNSKCHKTKTCYNSKKQNS